MDGYLGEFPIDIQASEFAAWGPPEWAMFWIEQYGQIDGEHHKTWALDQVARILKGTSVIVVEARWDNGETELRMHLDDPTELYNEWAAEMRGEDEGGEMEYEYNVGIAP